MCYQIANSGIRCTTLVELLRWRASHEPDRLAYTFLLDGEHKEAHLSYAELDRQARAIASRLQGLGAAGERAILLYQPGLEYIAAFFGCLYAGVVAVPAFPPRPNRPMPRLQTIMADGQVKFALATSDILENIEHRFDQAPNLRELCWLNTARLPAGSETTWHDPAITAEHLAFLQYTSGSTTTPRGVMLSHANLMHNLLLIQRAFECSPECRSVSWLPPYHDMGLIGSILEPLYSGAPAVLMAPAAFLQCPFRWLDAVSRYGAVISGGPNFAYDLCVQKITPQQREQLDLSHWSLAFNGAEPVRPQTLERFSAAFGPCGFRREAFYPCYGLAEGTLLVTGGRKAEPHVTLCVDGDALARDQVRGVDPQGKGARTLVGSGQSPESQRVLIVDTVTGTPCPPDRVGEIWIQGPSVGQGYWNRPEESGPVFAGRLTGTKEGPFLRTGDLGFLNNGELFVTGRAKDLIILHGKNYYPQDLELTVEISASAIRPGSSAAFAVDIDGQERLVIVAEVDRTSRHQNLDKALAEIRQAVSAHHEVPVWSLILIKTLTMPKTSSGKIQRQVCKEMWRNNRLEVVAKWSQAEQGVQQPTGPDRGHGFECEQTQAQGNTAHKKMPAYPDSAAIQDWLLSNIAERLHMSASDIDVRQPFARLGMDSMTALLLAGDLEAWLDRRLPPTLMYDFSSIEELARHLAQTATPEPEPGSNPVPGELDHETAAELLTRVDRMSGEEANGLLQKLLAGQASGRGTLFPVPGTSAVSC